VLAPAFFIYTSNYFVSSAGLFMSLPPFADFSIVPPLLLAGAFVVLLVVCDVAAWAGVSLGAIFGAQPVKNMIPIIPTVFSFVIQFFFR
jgi:hypothetical protein